MPSCRCQFRVIDPLTKTKRLCKNKKILNWDYCLIHKKMIFNIYAIKIQSIYRSYYVRKKLIIFYKLPRELQRIVIWNINKNIYLKHFNSSISKLVYKKVETFYKTDNYLNVLNFNHNGINFIMMSEPPGIEFFDHLNYIIRIIKKYEPILDINKLPYKFIVTHIQSFLIKLIKSIRFSNNVDFNTEILNGKVCSFIDDNWSWFINYNTNPNNKIDCMTLLRI